MKPHSLHSSSYEPALTISCTIVHLHMGKPVTDSLAISSEFLRRHDNVLQSLDMLIAEGTISHLDFKEREYTDKRGKKQRLIKLTERGALIAMPFIGGRNSKRGQVRLVNAFLALRDQVAKESGNWDDARKKVSTGYLMMCDALQEVRADNDKQTASHHYANEAKLVNWVLFGNFKSVTRDNMEEHDLVLMDKIEARNAIWIARGRTYDERKAAWPAYLLSLRTKGIEKAQ